LSNAEVKNHSSSAEDFSDSDVRWTFVPSHSSPFVVTNLTVSAGTNLVLKGNNDFAGGSVIVWAGTNVAMPLNQWTPVWTNGLGSGNFTFTVTNVVNVSIPQRFFRLQLFQIN
jgi:hypothetical protein